MEQLINTYREFNDLQIYVDRLQAKKIDLAVLVQLNGLEEFISLLSKVPIELGDIVRFHRLIEVQKANASSNGTSEENGQPIEACMDKVHEELKIGKQSISKFTLR
jgi:hypothetical protein